MINNNNDIIIVSQAEIFNMIKDLGGHATTENIQQIIKQKFPGYILYKNHFLDKLLKLKIKKLINYNPYRQTWYIIEDKNKNIIAISREK